jgi:hypothetical protein
MDEDIEIDPYYIYGLAVAGSFTVVSKTPHSNYKVPWIGVANSAPPFALGKRLKAYVFKTP